VLNSSNNRPIAQYPAPVMGAPSPAGSKTGRKRRTPGQSVPEYALTLALITVVCIAALQIMGNDLAGFFSSLANVISSTPTAP
jgi:Flp pilus assembly pilin Flp